MGEVVARSEESESVRLVRKALAQIRKGKMVILTDDEARENEGDLVMAAEKVSPASVNFMATHARGLICLSLTEERIRQLNLPLMVQDNTSQQQTAFTVSIEAARGTTTGISAADRARTILAAVAPRARVLVRAGQTEGSVDLARLAGLFPAGVICEIMNPDGTMARRPELLRFARKHRLTLLSVADVIRYRLENERLVHRVAEQAMERGKDGAFRAVAYASDVDTSVHLALIKGDISGGKPVLTRVHRGCLMGDLMGSNACDCGRQLEEAFRHIAQEGRGVLVYLQKDQLREETLLCTHRSRDKVRGQADKTRLREFGVGAQILKDLGLARLRLLTDNPKKIVGLESYDLQVVEQVPLMRPGVSWGAERGKRVAGGRRNA